MAFINSNKYGKWKGNLLVGSLKFQYITRCILKGNKVFKEVKMLRRYRESSFYRTRYRWFYICWCRKLGIVKLLPNNISILINLFFHC